MNPAVSLFHSRKFWLLVLDTVVSLVTFFVTYHAAPALAEEVIALLAIVQPLWIMVIKGITDEDVALKGNIYWGGVKGTGLPEKYGFTVEPDDPGKG